jgi:hypothetical protein
MPTDRLPTATRPQRPATADVSALWLPLLRDLTDACPGWTVWKNADAALHGDGDVDSSAPTRDFGRVRDVFVEWSRDQRLGPVVDCRHIPRVMFLAALDPERPTFFELDVLGRKYFRGAPLFVAEQLVPMSALDPEGFRRVRPGVEGVILLVGNGMRRGGAENRQGLQRRGVPALLAGDPEGVQMAAALFGPVAGSLLRLADAVARDDWDRPAARHLELWAVAKAAAAPAIPAGRAKLRLWSKRHCPLLRSVFFEDRRLPADRDAWLAEVSRTHVVLREGVR